LKELGVDSIPKTIQELFEVCKKITDPSKGQYGFSFRGKNQQIDNIHFLILPFLDDLDTTNFYKKTDGKLIFDDPRFIEGLKLYVRLFKETCPKDSINWGFNEQINAFGSGITPIVLQDADFINACANTIGLDKFMMTPPPVGPHGKAYSVLYLTSLAIPSYSEHKEEAWEFIKYLSSPKVNAYYAKGYNDFPIHSVTFKNDPYFSSVIFAPWRYMMEHPEVYVTGQPPRASSKYAAWMEISNDDLQSVELGNMTIEEMVNKWVEYWQ